MNECRFPILVLSIITLAITGCGMQQGSMGAGEAQDATQMLNDALHGEDTSGEIGGFQFGEDAKWPEYIPEAIPVFPGEIEDVLEAPGSHIRIFYSEVSDSQIEEYLALLEVEGFVLEFRIHIQEGFPDNSEERRLRGEYDDVVITKDKYHMTLSHGDGRATYDIYTSGFQEDAAQAMIIKWPEDLVGVLPQPARCELVSLSPYGEGGYHISCDRQDDAVDQDYLDLLASEGFQIEETIQNSDGEYTFIRVRKGDLVVNVSPIFSYFSMDVSLQPLPDWPGVFDDEIPKPKRCELESLIPSVQGDPHIICIPEDDRVLQDYVDVLLDLGFVEQHKFVNQEGEIQTIDLETGEFQIRLFLNSPDSLSVSVSRIKS